ncbi:phosphotransferase [Maridesulfovibrio salexigens]|uniref:Aminoglycoside phosphotransferase n=1 Tax=Maridesulfovibrio salexigens (strain ATCC 14822 / DSM 2638 / NCIMB 8403 / VKM B-1763) TaxID=526222 RepID=C6BXR9_MARSD|nr:phosphotransferase [Maridesulfovibrio salexigens]ACS78627.1 aminoglycoside phosphotransferase [Maridesulfovibrio salexigens DSM 2638]
MENSDPKKLIQRLTDETPLKAEHIRAGRNSRVYRVDCKSGRCLLAKFYLQPTADGRSRLKQEWTALNFMTGSGITNIPRPLKFDESVQGAIYSFISGNPVKETTVKDIDEVVSFLAKLKDISRLPAAIELPRAAEACFSPAELVESIRQRLKKLQALPAKDEVYQSMHSFLENKFRPALEECSGNAKQHFPAELWTAPLAQRNRTLSPSDFGFHNALRTEKGLAFVDFEYFGWDDPVKATSDFLLHPAMDLSAQQMAAFFAGMKNIFKSDENFVLRFKSYLPLFRLKWSMILLNEFINHHLERRKFASGEVGEHKTLRSQQLDKAENFLNKDQQILTVLNLRN